MVGRDLTEHFLKILTELLDAGIESLPSTVGLCKQLERLNISGNPLRTLPCTISSLPHLTILFASNAAFSVVPPVLADCHQLKMIGLNNNRLTSIDGASLPQSLEWLIAARNQIEELPNIARLCHVRKLMLSHNRLTCEALAPVAGISALEMIRVAENRLKAFPDALLCHPRLSWVAVGGNPFAEACMKQRLDKAVPPVSFDEVSLGSRLGSGAGATVYGGKWREREVAVKIWEAECFSDGTAQGEWSVNRVVGDPGHPALIGLWGTFETPRPGMILEKLEGGEAAACPPSFSPWTVTRDVLPSHKGPKSGPALCAKAALSVARTVAEACMYLHEKGIQHGDVYLHNTLVVLAGSRDCAEVRDTRLSDFGAAAAVDDPRFFKLEARSFGWLLQDLLELMVRREEDGLGPEDILRKTRQLCGQTSVDDLPHFSQIVAALATADPVSAL
eukprot:TRINITY_DN24600_c0_g1_i2.p1 TRINITY_DN24600_c0_g1~~TRINITY_DN24600_c0_g1_i2.p1  ORF type:complete len:447 (+),score=66.74 TRINITY_DN24600_c0_g1_i2:43-1383(+)